MCPRQLLGQSMCFYFFRMSRREIYWQMSQIFLSIGTYLLTIQLVVQPVSCPKCFMAMGILCGESISHRCIPLCLLSCGYVISDYFISEFVWIYYPFPTGLLHCHAMVQSFFTYPREHWVWPNLSFIFNISHAGIILLEYVCNVSEFNRTIDKGILISFIPNVPKHTPPPPPPPPPPHTHTHTHNTTTKRQQKEWRKFLHYHIADVAPHAAFRAAGF